MKLQLEPYRRLRLNYDELCVAAAFLEIPCIYGVPSRIMKADEGSLHEKATRIVSGMELKGFILVELTGTVRMDRQLYQLVDCLGRAERVCRVGYTTSAGERHLYLYRKGNVMAFLERDGHNSCYLGRLGSAEQLQQMLAEVPQATGPAKQQDLFFGNTQEWMSGLVFEKKGTFYDLILDFGWKESDDPSTSLTDLWQKLCRCLEVAQV